jgi:hypothetical protein
LATAVALLVACPGCVRESVSPEAAEYHYKWWVWLWGLTPLVIAGVMVRKYPTLWIDGAWRPWWLFRDWHLDDFGRAAVFLILAIIGPFQLCNRMAVDDRGFESDNALGLRAYRRVAWTDVSRVDVKTASPVGEWTPDQDRAHRKAPDLVAVFRDGRTQEFRGWLVAEATQEIVRRARAAGVAVAETDAPGAPGAPGAPPPPPFRAPVGGPAGRGL